MSDVVLQVRGLTKRYRLGQLRSVDRSFRELLSGAAAALWRRRPPARCGLFTALNDVSFDVRQGEVVGVIGRNGAGKSTLLKILSRITDPTAGFAAITGRIGSLLEVGAGFHPELTGRENIFLCGAILGMSRSEVARKFDQIVAFAEVEKFLDTPVKRYSSGMYVRLAFAVAAHLEPEVLLVDEVLAVGDAAFQKKCLGKMGDVARQGRTVLFVSHNMSAVQNLCTRALRLENGTLADDGPAVPVVNRYIQQSIRIAQGDLEQRTDRGGDGSVRVRSVRIENIQPDKPIQSGSRLRVTVAYRHDGPLRRPRFLVGIYDLTNTGIYLLDSDAFGEPPDELPAAGELVCVTDPINLTPGRCYVNVAVKKGGSMADYVTQAATFDVEPDDTLAPRHMPGRDWVIGLLRQNWSYEGKAAA